MHGAKVRIKIHTFRSKPGDSVTDTYGKCPGFGVVSKGYVSVSHSHELLIASNFVLYCTSRGR